MAAAAVQVAPHRSLALAGCAPPLLPPDTSLPSFQFQARGVYGYGTTGRPDRMSHRKGNGGCTRLHSHGQPIAPFIQFLPRIPLRILLLSR